MKTKFIFTCLFALSFLFITSNCSREDDIIEDIVGDYEYGDDVVSEGIVYSGFNGFTFDKTHSSVRWESEYQETGALLTGRFNSFAMAIEFVENDPDNIELNGSVVLSTVNTGEPGRDEGCLMGTFNTSVGGTEEATFQSTSVEFDGEGGYIVTGEFEFNGTTDVIVGVLKYTGSTLKDRGDQDESNDYYLAGFIMEFDILAKSVHGITSGNIADRVHIICSSQFKASRR